MNLKNYKEYCFANYKSVLIETNNNLKLGDVVMCHTDEDGNSCTEIGIIIQINYRDEVRLDSCGMIPTKNVRLATDSEIEQYRPNILEENFNKEQAEKWKN